jgi:hypothetical protein
VRNEILAKNPSMPLDVLVVWFNMLPGDTRLLLDTRTLADPRVTNYWDDQKLVGAWYSEHVNHRPGVTWDAFFLYGPQAQWSDEPEPLVSSGGTVIGQRDRLLAGLGQLQLVAA